MNSRALRRSEGRAINILSLSLKIDDKNAHAFCVLIAGVTGFSQLISESCVLNATVTVAAAFCCWLVGAVQPDFNTLTAGWQPHIYCCTTSSLRQPSLKRGGRKRDLNSLEKTWPVGY